MASPRLQREYSVEERYGFIKHIGKGSYADVWMVVPLDMIGKGTRYVLKRINLHSMTHNALEAAEREAKLLSSLEHPNIIRYIESFRSWDSHLNIVMSYCEGGDLHTKIEQKKSDGQMFEETKVIEWCIQICMALDYLHKRHILHRDIKTKNIFLTKHEIIKVGDFGISRVLNGAQDLATTIIGTPYYMSPEVLLGKPYDQKSDIWALGCCMYELVNLDFAFKAVDMNSLVLRVIQGDIPKIRGNYSDELKRIIQTMLSVQSDDRPTASDILKHKYIKRHILQMIEDTKQRVENKTHKKQQKKRNFSTLPSESEFRALLSNDGSKTTSLGESYSGESRTRQRQTIAAQPLPTSDTMAKSIAAFSSNANSALSNADELERWERCPVENLTHYFEQHEKEHEEDNHHDQLESHFISISNSFPGTMITTEYQPPAIETIQLRNQGQYETNYRYSDIGNLPDQTLLPITGYNEKPLTSLEVAIRPVRHLLVANIDATISVAKENAQKRHGPLLSVDESAAIQLYTMETLPLSRCLYYILNKTLRTAARRELIPWFPYLKLLMTALWKLPSVQRPVWRGIKGVNLSEQYQIGECYTWWNLSSCTDTITTMQKPQFLGTEGHRTLFNIECLDGKDIREHSYVQSENEILLPPATHFKVLGKINVGADLHIIQIQQIPPPYELISPPF